MSDEQARSNANPETEKESTARKAGRVAVKLVWVVPAIIAAMELLPRSEAALSFAPRLLNVVPNDLLALIQELDAELNDAQVVPAS